MKFDETDKFTKIAHNKDSVFKDSFTLFLNKSLEFLDADLAGQVSEILNPETTAVEAIGDFAVKIFNETLGTFGVHKEFEVDVSKDDLMRFCGYNIYLSRKHKIPSTTIIITEKRPTVVEYQNQSITFKPKIICLKERDGDATLKKIKQQLAAGEPINELELIYLPMYGSEQGTTLYEFLDEVLKITPQIGDTATMTKKLQILILFLTIRTADIDEIKKVWVNNMGLLKDNVGIQALIEIGIDKGEENKKNKIVSMMQDLLKQGSTAEEILEYIAENA
ncbi:MAG: hypothetical protein FWG68_04265 [Defluviitaleaceae bacterium]|nr:hypothetical protein [Defluviitaleaceae bacterium]